MHHPTNTLIGTFLMAAITGCSTPNPTPGEEGAWFDEVRWKHRLMVVSGPSDDIGPQLAAGKATRIIHLQSCIIHIQCSTILIQSSIIHIKRKMRYFQRSIKFTLKVA